MSRAITKCPRCGSHVTHYAAGCAVCGEDIQALREARAARSVRMPVPATLPRLAIGDDGLRIVIALLLALAAPIVGLALACWFAWQTHSEGRTRTRNALLVVAVIAALPMVTGIYPWGRFLAGF
jgi:anti-sigma factor RsiW